jgi:hypothetical protein
MAPEGTNNPDKRPLTGRKGRAALLLAQEELTHEEISNQVGISRRQLFRWKQHPDFQAQVRELAAEMGELALRYAIGRRARRLKALDERWHALEKRRLQIQRVIQERAGHPDVAGKPGGETGLVVRQLKAVGSGPAAQVVEEYPVDVALLREEVALCKEMAAHERQAAQELGQWVEKVAPTSPDGEESYEPRGYGDAERLAILEQLAARLGFAAAAAPGGGQEGPGGREGGVRS